MTFEEFEKLCDEGNLVPVMREQIADLDTPVSVLARFVDNHEVFLLESVEGAERFGRYSFLGVNPRGVLLADREKTVYLSGGEEKILPHGADIFGALRELLIGIRPAKPKGCPGFFGGAVGYLGYEAVNAVEKLPEPKDLPPGPVSAFMIADETVIFDNVRHTVGCCVSVRPVEYPSRRAAYDDALRRIEKLSAQIRRPLVVPECAVSEAPSLRPSMGREDFCEMVRRGRRAIRDGEAIQIVLSQKFTAPLTVPPLQLYRALRLINPSPYTFFLKIGERTLIGSSPETLVKLDQGRMILRPIAGTRKRGATRKVDLELADELLRDEKERAEHLMLVDLARNDLGRVALPGSVQVGDFMTVERYSHVMHLVSQVEALIAPGLDGFDLVRSAFPAGTLSGAPKVRAMELIHELEPGARGTYGGAVGYFSYTGDLDLAITIRTIHLEKGELAIQSGAGIVSDSEPETEYEETINKGAAMFQAVRLAANNLDLGGVK